MNILLCVAAFVIGIIVYVITPTGSKANELARLAYFAGLLVFLLLFEGARLVIR